mmetsp:Transcript_86067/g.196331  ORF Transcript_86067/g.196331 Transcript_86067/m.196331 type:complete len:196 (+) Transcript_86067:1977-2564(+)
MPGEVDISGEMLGEPAKALRAERLEERRFSKVFRVYVQAGDLWWNLPKQLGGKLLHPLPVLIRRLHGPQEIRPGQPVNFARGPTLHRHQRLEKSPIQFSSFRVLPAITVRLNSGITVEVTMASPRRMKYMTSLSSSSCTIGWSGSTSWHQRSSSSSFKVSGVRSMKNEHSLSRGKLASSDPEAPAERDCSDRMIT